MEWLHHVWNTIHGKRLGPVNMIRIEAQQNERNFNIQKVNTTDSSIKMLKKIDDLVSFVTKFLETNGDDLNLKNLLKLKEQVNLAREYLKVLSNDSLEAACKAREKDIDAATLLVERFAENVKEDFICFTNTLEYEYEYEDEEYYENARDVLALLKEFQIVFNLELEVTRSIEKILSSRNNVNVLVVPQPMKRKAEQNDADQQIDKENEIKRMRLVSKTTETLHIKIRNGEKTVEVRICNEHFSEIQFIIFVCGSERIKCRVLVAEKFVSFGALKKWGHKKCLPNSANVRDAIKIYHAIENYQTLASQHGVVAYHVEQVN